MKLLRPVSVGVLFAACLCFSQYLSAIIIFPAVSFVIAVIERQAIAKVVTNKLFLFITTALWAIIFFFAKIYASDYFNNKYGIFVEYLNHSVYVKAVINATISLILFYCMLLMFYFTFKMLQTQQQPLQEWFAKFPEFATHAFTCTIVFAFVASLFSIVDKYDTNILRLDAHKNSDCRTFENQIAIRKDNQTCYSFVPKSVARWELQTTSSPKH